MPSRKNKIDFNEKLYKNLEGTTLIYFGVFQRGFQTGVTVSFKGQ